jgi:hypothetical protein
MNWEQIKEDVPAESDPMKLTRDGKNHNRNRCSAIEFIGGPYDGHVLQCLTQPVHLPANVVWLVCEDAFRMLDGKESCPRGSITSVAIYELEITNTVIRYRFARAISVNKLTRLMRDT